MPPLEDLFADNMANVSLDRLTGNYRGPSTRPQMWMNLVRLTDLSLRSYEGARSDLERYRARAHKGHVSPYYDAINRLEETVVATYRAILNSGRLQTLIPRKLHEPTARQLQAIRQVRHHIQHMDEKLADGRAEIHVLVPTTKSVVIGRKQLHYRDLASCITKCYRNIELIRQAPSK
jgi:hypothetical protein